MFVIAVVHIVLIFDPGGPDWPLLWHIGSIILLPHLFVPFTANIYVRPRRPRIKHYWLMRKARSRHNRPLTSRSRPFSRRQREGKDETCDDICDPVDPDSIDPNELEDLIPHELYRWKGYALYQDPTFRRHVHNYLRGVDVLDQYYSIRHWSTYQGPNQRHLSFSPVRHRILVASTGRASSVIRVPFSDAPSVYIAEKTVDELPIVLDTGASWSITPDLRDFVSDIEPSEMSGLRSLDSNISVHGIGTVEWELEDINGHKRTVRTKALYVPTAEIRLFSPQRYFMDEEAGFLICRRDKVELFLADGHLLEFPYNSGSHLPIMLTSSLLEQHQAHAQYFGLNVTDLRLKQEDFPSALPTLLDPENYNLSGSQKELLLWHLRLGHRNLAFVQSLLSQPKDSLGRQVIVPRNKRASSCKIPLCEACQYAKQKRRVPSRLRTQSAPEGGQSDGVLKPGQRVSLDLYQSSIPGRLEHTYGKEKESSKYAGGAIFLDIASKLVFINHQSNLTAAATLSSKHLFERFADEFGVKIKEYLADNEPFRAQEFVQDCINQRQNQSFSGVGAHHQNSVERSVQNIFNSARAMLLHFILHWPQQTNLQLWPFAVAYAAWIWNNTPDLGSRLSPLEVFTGSRAIDYKDIRRTRVFGCPVYVLHPKLQDAKKIPKWHRRSRRDVFLGFSPQHHSTVALVLNTETGSISPQYHVVFDEHFSTVSSDPEGNVLTDAQLETLLETGHHRHAALEDYDLLDEDDDSPTGTLHDPFYHLPPDFDRSVFDPFVDTSTETTSTASSTDSGVDVGTSTDDIDTADVGVQAVNPDERMHHTNASTGRSEQGTMTEDEPLDGSTEVGSRDTPDSPSFPTNDDYASDVENDPQENTPRDSPTRESPATPRRVRFADESDLLHEERSVNQNITPQSILRRTSRTTAGQQPRRLISSPSFGNYANVRRHFASLNLSKTRIFPSDQSRIQRARHTDLNNQALASLDWSFLKKTCLNGTYGALLSEMSRNTQDGYIEEWNPSLLATKANAEDTPTFDQAMSGPLRNGFIEACKTELDTLTRKGAWEVVDRPKNKHVVSSTWAFKIKRIPDGCIRKLKARFCARGYEQKEGVDYHETFAPVVNWTTVRFLLIMSILLNLKTKQVDYVAAFIQSDIDTEVFVEMPRGFSTPGKVLRLKKSLYGLKQSPRNHFNNLSSKLEELGFEASEADPCLFVSDKVICLVYVDDTLFFSREESDIDSVISGLRSLGMELEEESDVAGFLGVHIERRDDGSIKLTQKGLIQRIIDALDIDHLPPKQTPSKPGVLAADKDGDPANGTYSYASVIGMLGYLAPNSRPELTFAVSQCARFTHSPKRSHEEALERIGQYLKGTREDGLILRPTPMESSFHTDIYVDADFAGGWGFEDPNDPSCVRSRTGFLIEVMGCPVHWSSKLQTNISTSTMEAEYTALSMALRAAIPFMEVCRYVISKFRNPATSSLVTFKTTVHEDNMGALTLANLEPGRTTPRSKFYAIKFHWFRSWLKPKEIEIQYIDTKQQKADILTKSLTVSEFLRARKLTCGW